MTDTADNMPDPPTVWVLKDPRAGTAAQALGVAEALGCPFEVKDLDYNPLSRLPNVLIGAGTAGLTRESARGLAEPWPDLVITAGRRSAPVARWVKRRSGGRSRCVQIMYPGAGGLAEFDLVAVPNHDAVPAAANLIRITGAPHRLTAGKLAAARREWNEELGRLPRPLVALLVGGATRRRAFTAGQAATLGRRAAALVSGGGTILATTSRRTGPEAAAALERALSEAVPDQFRFYRFGDPRPNPYLGYLACSDAVVVTGESISMACEACAGGKQVYIFAPEGHLSERHGRFVAELIEAGFARPLGDRLEDWTPPGPLDTAGAVARAIRERLAIR